MSELTMSELTRQVLAAARSDEIAVDRGNVAIRISAEGRVAIRWGGQTQPWHVACCNASGPTLLNRAITESELGDWGDDWVELPSAPRSEFRSYIRPEEV